MNRKVSCFILISLILVPRLVALATQSEPSSKIGSFSSVTMLDIQGDEQWNESQRNLELKYEEFVKRKSSITQQSIQGVNVLIQEPFIIREIPEDYLSIYIEIQNTNRESENSIRVNAVEICYRSQGQKKNELPS